MLYQFIYSFLLPPGLFILFLFGFGIWLIIKHNKMAGRITLILALALYLVSTPFISYPLLHSLETRYQPPTKPDGDVIVMLAGGATYDTPDIGGNGMLNGSGANRLLATARLQRMTGLPVILSGGNPVENNESEIAMRQLIGLGIPGNNIILDETSRNTKENAENTKALLIKLQLSHPILATSAFHMERSMKNFAKFGVSAIPFPTDYLVDNRFDVVLLSFAPSASALSNTSTAIKEYLGLLAIKMGL